MNKNLKGLKITLLIASCILVLASHCSRQSLDVAGGGSDTEVSGRIVSADGKGNPGVKVLLINAQYNPAFDTASSDILTDTTDADGAYRFERVKLGAYNIQAQQLDNAACRLLPQVLVSWNKTVLVSDDSLRKPVSLRVYLSDSISVAQGYLYIPGTTIARYFAAGAQVVEFDSIPQGKIGTVQCQHTAISAKQALFENVQLDSTRITSLYSVNSRTKMAKLFFNTTSTGAGIASNILNFPILVRLTKSSFDFASAKSDGSDIRFQKSNGSPLSYEIEQWDAGAGVAAIWVRVDTVYGNDSSHYAIMLWGLRSAGSATVSLSNSSAVFDTAYGNCGVWHFGTSLSDATVYGDNGTDSSTVDGIGIIGRCRIFNPNNRSFITIPAARQFNITANITLSAWVKIDSLTTKWETIIAKGDNTYRLHVNTASKTAYFSMSDSDTANFGYEDAGGTTVLSDNAWHLVTGVFDGTVMRLYVDGVLESTRNSSKPCLINNLDITIGDNIPRTPRFFFGSIDEMRVLRTAVDKDWVRLCYMNQKENESLLRMPK